MARYVLTVFKNALEGKEADFEAELDQHVPQYLNVEGVVNTKRLHLQEMRTSPPGQTIHQYLSLYEIETDDIDDFKRRFTASHPGPRMQDQDREATYTLFFEEDHHWDQANTPTPHQW